MEKRKLRDRVWLWGQNAGSHHGKNNPYNLPGENKMTPREGLDYFGISRCCRVVMGNQPEPPFDNESKSMAGASEVVWSIIGSGSSDRTVKDGWDEVDEVARQAAMYPNVTGVIMDDFISPTRQKLFPPSRVEAMKSRVAEKSGRPLPLWMVWYEYQLEAEIDDYLPLVDVVSLWTWYGQNLIDIKENFARLAERTPGKRRLAGCYLYDYGNRMEFSEAAMEHQCSAYLDLMKEGTIDGIIICSNCIADIGFPASGWMKIWMDRNGDMMI